MNKRKLFNKIARIITYENRGNIWTNYLQSLFQFSAVISLATVISLKFPEIHYYLIIAGVIIFGIIAKIFWFLIRVWIGKYDLEKGLWSAQNEFNQKNEGLNPFNRELVLTLRNICQKIGTKDEFLDLK
jgi:hypothetical protein